MLSYYRQHYLCTGHRNATIYSLKMGYASAIAVVMVFVMAVLVMVALFLGRGDGEPA